MKQQVWVMILINLLVWAEGAVSESSFENWRSLEQALIAKSVTKQWIPMRDGVRLDANIYFPKNAKAPYPTILIRTPYPSDFFLDYYATRNIYARLLKQGYVIIYQNERGRYGSEGNSSYLANARDDGYDTVDWIAKQPWSNARVGTLGCSSSAENQLGLSVARHPAHKAAIAEAPGAGIGVIGPYAEQGNIYRGGALQLWAPPWFGEYIMYGGEGADQRPQFPGHLSQADRSRLAKHFDLNPVYPWGKFREGVDYQRYFAHLPSMSINRAADLGLTDWEQFVQRSPADPTWRQTHFVNEGDQFGVPMLWLFSWYDLAVAPNIAMYKYARENSVGAANSDNQFMLISPMMHCGFGYESEETLVGERELGDARYDYDQHTIDWFNYWLKDEDNEVLQRPKVSYYQMGANQWRSAEQFPPANTESLSFYLDSQGGANSLYGDGILRRSPAEESEVDTLVYDPLSPVPSLGGGTCCMGNLKQMVGAYDQRPVEARQDVLVYTSDVFTEALDLSGFVEAELYVSSDALDTDFTLKLVDVYPDGRAYNLSDTIFRARYRESYAQAQMMRSGEVVKIVFPPMATANTFKPGHRLRLEISSSNFPRYERNLNTGGNNFDETEAVTARNAVHHSPEYHSRLILTVVKSSAGLPK